MSAVLADAEAPARSYVDAELNYLGATSERPRNYTFDPPDGEPRSNATHETHRVRVFNLRDAAAPPALDREGFELVHHQSAVTDFYDDEQVRRVYYPEAERLVKEATGADRVFIFDHTIRRRVSGAEDRIGGAPRQPATRVHVDHTEASGPQRVRDFFPDEADALLKGRVEVVNVWRPIRGPLKDAPLAMCDVRTVDANDLVPSDLVYRDRVGETYGVKYNPEQRWFYAPDMRPDEALLLKCYDSLTDGTSRFSPHTAFEDPTTPADAPPRESIELRTLVFHRG